MEKLNSSKFNAFKLNVTNANSLRGGRQRASEQTEVFPAGGGSSYRDDVADAARAGNC